jgi:uncharacterized protein
MRMVGEDPGRLNATSPTKNYYYDCMPLMVASDEGHVDLVQWLVDNGASMDEGDTNGWTALRLACRDGPPNEESRDGRFRVVRLLTERGAAIASYLGSTPLVSAPYQGRLDVVRLFLSHPSGKTTINQRDKDGETALWRACSRGHGEVARALLKGGADFSVATNGGSTPMAVAKQQPEKPAGATAEGRRECVAALR